MAGLSVFAACLCLGAFCALAGCAPAGVPPAAARSPVEAATLIPQATRTPSRTSAYYPSPTVTSPSPVALPELFEPAGCRAPVDDYRRVKVNGYILNQRTLSMLQYAAELYGGPIDVAGAAITQGSYSSNGPASFGTHLGGGAVDISVIKPGGRSVLYFEIEPLVRALRTAGFAAWLRDWGELGPGSGIHIHAIAIGDAELSPAALDQLNGPFGYFRGYSGVPTADGVPLVDRHGGPILCGWMRKLGYADLRPAPARLPTSRPWRTALKEAAQSYVVATAAESLEVARRLDFRPGNNEHPSNMCGPLAAAILRDAGLLPLGYGPGSDLRQYWLANPRANGRPWSLFPPRDYELFHFDTPINRFDFAAWPLLPADFIYTYQGRDGYEHMFVVTEVDSSGRAYTVTNNKQPDATYIIQRVMLYDPQDPSAGVFRNEWVASAVIGRTGTLGFDVLRRKGVTLPPGSRYAYTVRPGDTLPQIAAEYGTTPEAVAAANPDVDWTALEVGRVITVIVGGLTE